MLSRGSFVIVKIRKFTVFNFLIHNFNIKKILFVNERTQTDP